MPCTETDDDGWPFDPVESARLSRIRLARDFERARAGRLAAATEMAVNAWTREERRAEAALIAALRQDGMTWMRLEHEGLIFRVDGAGEIVRERIDGKVRMHEQPRVTGRRK